MNDVQFFAIAIEKQLLKAKKAQIQIFSIFVEISSETYQPPWEYIKKFFFFFKYAFVAQKMENYVNHCQYVGHFMLSFDKH